MLTDEVGHLAITRCFGLALVGDWRAAEQARRQSKPGREDDPPNWAAPAAPSRYFPVIPRSIAMGATGGTPMARAVLTRTPEGLDRKSTRLHPRSQMRRPYTLLSL